VNIKLTTIDNFKLDADFYQGSNGKGIIFTHGMTVPRQDEEPFLIAAEKLNKLGFSALLFDFRAHGKSQGNSVKDFTISNELIDLQAAFDYMKTQLLASQGLALRNKEVWIGLAGASFGGGVVSLYSARHKETVKKLYLVNPLLNFQEGLLNSKTPWCIKYFTNALRRVKKEGYIEAGSHKYKIGLKFFKEIASYSPATELASYPGPIEIVHSPNDTYVFYDNCKKYFENLPQENKKFTTILNAEHGLSEEPYASQAANLITNFFSK